MPANSSGCDTLGLLLFILSTSEFFHMVENEYTAFYAVISRSLSCPQVTELLNQELPATDTWCSSSTLGSVVRRRVLGWLAGIGFALLFIVISLLLVLSLRR